jgi:cellulose synthase/poly-beta-1,6-N-acetylglucosamine synthase-like glycosyltransferase
MNIRLTIINYLALAIILGGGIWSFITLQGNQSAQLAIGIVLCVTYALWGIMFHSMKKDLHMKVVIEYVLVSAIAILVLMIVLRY